jgi:hypothetical protein
LAEADATAAKHAVALIQPLEKGQPVDGERYAHVRGEVGAAFDSAVKA